MKSLVTYNRSDAHLYCPVINHDPELNMFHLKGRGDQSLALA
jgi:hypothetical protein